QVRQPFALANLRGVGVGGIETKAHLPLGIDRGLHADRKAAPVVLINGTVFNNTAPVIATGALRPKTVTPAREHALSPIGWTTDGLVQEVVRSTVGHFKYMRRLVWCQCYHGVPKRLVVGLKPQQVDEIVERVINRYRLLDIVDTLAHTKDVGIS